jgi:hypothetical protein
MTAPEYLLNKKLINDGVAALLPRGIHRLVVIFGRQQLLSTAQKNRKRRCLEVMVKIA